MRKIGVFATAIATALSAVETIKVLPQSSVRIEAGWSKQGVRRRCPWPAGGRPRQTRTDELAKAELDTGQVLRRIQ